MGLLDTDRGLDPSSRLQGPLVPAYPRRLDREIPSKKSVRSLDAGNRRVFVRVDFNVPLEAGSISDDTRIRASLPTIELLAKQGARIVLASHMGRPKGNRDEALSLRPAAERLGELLGAKVALAPDCVGDAVEKQAGALGRGQVLMLENLRFHAGEEKNDPAFARSLAKLGDIYVNDAFGTAHRAHASTVGVPELLRPAVAGLLMERELEFLGKALHNPERPFYAILGGAKVTDKIGVIRKLLETSDGVLIGGAMAYTFLVAMRRHIGASLVELDKVEIAREILIESLRRNVPIYLPLDHVVASERTATAKATIVHRDMIPEGYEGLDIGPSTAEMYADILRRGKMVIWNGPMGMFEIEQFAHGTNAIAQSLAELDATTIVGGGDCVAAVRKAGVADRLSHISTGGGASLEFLEGRELPGVAALTDA